MKRKELIHMAIGMIIWFMLLPLLNMIVEPSSIVEITMGGVWGGYIGHIVSRPTARLLWLV